MLGLKLATDPRWVNIVESNIDEILTDHAYCEQKAASNAISLIVHYPEYSDMVEKMSEIAREELEHFQQVHQLITDRGGILGRERKDDYVNELMQFIKQPNRSREATLVDRLLFAAMIEARSCERFRVLSENIKDEKLAGFYRDLMISEANHYTVFIGFARKYGQGVNVEERWKEFLEYEADVISRYGNKETIHG
ncbi:MAG: tRNA-(ms[2]io[6]A)-hydroxylase [Bacteroidota bacterium]|jgi:tRNA-(ms[2]io[6]A)-hydroxylase